MTLDEQVEKLGASIEALVVERDALAAEVATLREGHANAIGEHRFPDQTWKARCEETVRDLAAARGQRRARTCARRELRDGADRSGRSASGDRDVDLCVRERCNDEKQGEKE